MHLRVQHDVLFLICSVTLGLILTALPGCGDGSGNGTSTASAERGTVESPYRIAVIPKGTTHEFWKSIHAGARHAAAELAESGVGVQIIWKGPLREDDREDQIQVVETFVAQGVEGMVLAPLDDRALVRPVRDATRRQIPVVIIDSDLQSEDITSFVATDNRLGGYLAGKHLAELLEGTGRVAMLRYQEGSASTAQRESGFMEAISEYPDMVVVSSNQYGGATTETAYRASENMLEPLKSGDGSLQADGIFTPNESTTFGMLRALQDGGYAGQVKFVGFDASTQLVRALEQGQIHALAVQNPVLMGRMGVLTLVAHLRGESVEARVDTGVQIATPENMHSEALRDVLNPTLD